MLDYKREYERWLASDALNADEKAELQAIAGDEKEIESRFYGPLEFGTAGLRGTMKVGLHQMNVHVIRWATQGFADVIAAEGDEAKQKGVAICMDCRVNSMAFARAAAEVCAANGIRVRIFESLRPTPELSFAVRYYGCQAGINVTASHNPKEYNGYKVYWADGAQLPPQHAAAIAARLEQIDIFTGVKRMAFDDAVKAGLITLLGEETDKMFMSNVMAMINDRASVAQVADSFKVVYTPFHGCGWKLVPEALRGLGVKNLYCVEQQMVLDGTFPTVASPNPENPEGFYLAIELADKVGADFILGTDPDSDRVGIMVRGADGKFIAVTGNQTGVLLLDYVCRMRAERGEDLTRKVAVTTIVSSAMVDALAAEYGFELRRCLTGFKYIGDIITELADAGEADRFIFGFEESYGYLSGDHVRDKDAVNASLLICQMAQEYKLAGKNLAQAMRDLYAKHGWWLNRTVSLSYPGADGAAKMADLMAGLRTNAPAELAGRKVEAVVDYQGGVNGLPSANVVEFDVEGGNKVIVRPRGTEPKIKLYVFAKDASREAADALLNALEEAGRKLLA